MALTLEDLAARLDTLEARNADLEATVAGLEEKTAPSPPADTVFCTECFAEILIADGENWPDPDQGDAPRWRCADRKVCRARIDAAAEHAEQMRQAHEAEMAAARAALIEEAKAQIREEDARLAALPGGEG